MTGPRRETYGRLLLFAVLLLGVVTMHTLGHPSENGPAAHSSMAAVHHEVRVPMPESVTAVSPLPDPMGGMDPSSVCLAVLGAFTLVLLLAAALGGGRPVCPGAPSPTRLLHALWPNPPPPRLLLTRLSVLRI